MSCWTLPKIVDSSLWATGRPANSRPQPVTRFPSRSPPTLTAAGLRCDRVLLPGPSIRGRLASRRPSGSRTYAKGSEPTQLSVFGAFLIVLALVILVLVFTHVIPGN